MLVTITGKVLTALEKREGVSKSSGTAWASQEYVVEEENGDINVFNVFGQDKIDQYGLKRGMKVSATCILKANEWNGRYFTQLSCTKCFVEQNNSQQVQQERQAQAQQQTQQQQVVQQNQQQFNSVSAGDLPF